MRVRAHCILIQDTVHCDNLLVAASKSQTCMPVATVGHCTQQSRLLIVHTNCKLFPSANSRTAISRVHVFAVYMFWLACIRSCGYATTVGGATKATQATKVGKIKLANNQAPRLPRLPRLESQQTKIMSLIHLVAPI